MSTPINRSYVLLGALLVVVVGALLWLAGNVETLRRQDGQRYTVALDDGAGLPLGSPVRLAGVDVGRVERSEVRGGQALLTLVLEPEIELHVDASAGPRAKSLLGQKYLELRPGSEGAPLLPAGGAIPTSWTSYEVDEALNDLEPVLGQHGSLADALDGFGPLLARLRSDDAPRKEPSEAEAQTEAEELAASVDELREDAASTRASVEAVRDELPELLGDANASLTGRELRRSLDALDRVSASTARELPATLDEGAQALDRADRALAEVEEFGRSLTPERVAELDALLGEVAEASAEARTLTVELDGLGDDAGPLIAKLALISRRVTAIDELTIRRFLQREGLVIRIFGGERKQGPERIDALER